MARRRDVNDDATPRDRLLRRGAQALTDSELLSILLRTNKEAAGELLDAIGGMIKITAVEHSDLGDTTRAHKAALLAAVEFARRVARARMPKRVNLQRTHTVVRYLRMTYERPSQEVVGALFLDIRRRLIHDAEIFRGAFTRAAVEPRAIM